MAGDPAPPGPGPKGPIVVAGVGNDLAGDDGLGVHVVRALARRGAGAGVEVVEVGLSGDCLLAALAGCGHLVLVDAMRGGAPPGTIYRAEVAGVTDVLDGLDGDSGPLLSLHQLGLGEVLRQARLLGRMPPRVTLIGAEPACLEPSLELSPELAAAEETIVAALAGEFGGGGAGATLSRHSQRPSAGTHSSRAGRA